MPLTALAAVATAALGLVAVTTTPALADWTYERVTPIDKDGGSVRVGDTFRASTDGDRLLYSSTGSFAGVPAASSPQYVRYLAHRGASGWSNVAVDPPWDQGVFATTIMLTVGSSANLEWVVTTSSLALLPGAHPGGSNLYVRNTRTGKLYLAAATSDVPDFTEGLSQSQGAINIKFVGNDGIIVFTSFAGAELLPDEAPGANSFRWTPERGLEAVGRLPLADGGGYSRGNPGHSSNELGVLGPIPYEATGQRTYFTAGSGAAGPIYMLGTSGSDPMVPVSRDRTTANLGTMRPGFIAGTSHDGRYLVFQLSTTNQKLTDDTPTLPSSPRYIYRYDSVTDELEPVGAATNAQFTVSGSGVRWVSPDAKTVLYQANAVHAPGATNGQPNLYVWREGEGISWVATTNVGVGWLQSASRNGRYYVFTSNSASLAQRFGYDNNSVGCSTTASPALCDLVYRYDVEADHLECVSCRPDGQPLNGHTGAALVSGNGPGVMRMDMRVPQRVANDGTVFFDSRDPLVPADLNGEYDTYAWRDGDFRLVSRAAPGTLSRFIDATPDGRTVFFATPDRIVPSDTDRSYDIYAARLDGGFVEESDGEPVACSGSDCRGPVSPPPTLPNIGSITFGGDGNVPLVPDPVRVSVGVSKLKSVTGSAAKLKVRVPDAGRVSVAGSSIRRTGVSASKAGVYRLRIVLRPRARKLLRKRNRLRVSARMMFRAKDGQSAAKTISVTFNQPKSKRAKARKGGR